jgi:hypothetical protein
MAMWILLPPSQSSRSGSGKSRANEDQGGICQRYAGRRGRDLVAVYKLLTAKGVSFVGTPDAAEGPSTFFLRGEVEKSDQSIQRIHIEATRAMTPTDAGASARAKAIARGLINTERAATGLQLKNGMLRLECLSGSYY